MCVMRLTQCCHTHNVKFMTPLCVLYRYRMLGGSALVYYALKVLLNTHTCLLLVQLVSVLNLYINFKFTVGWVNQLRALHPVTSTEREKWNDTKWCLKEMKPGSRNWSKGLVIGLFTLCINQSHFFFHYILKIDKLLSLLYIIHIKSCLMPWAFPFQSFSFTVVYLVGLQRGISLQKQEQRTTEKCWVYWENEYTDSVHEVQFQIRFATLFCFICLRWVWFA